MEHFKTRSPIPNQVNDRIIRAIRNGDLMGYQNEVKIVMNRVVQNKAR
jgi:hypothetical protein